MVGGRIEEEDARLAPRPALHQQGEALPGEGMKRMRDREEDLVVVAIRCCCRVVQTARPRAR